MKTILYIIIILFAKVSLGKAKVSKKNINDTIKASYKGGEKAYANFIKTNYFIGNRAEEGKIFKIIAEVYFYPNSTKWPEPRISDKSSKNLTEFNKICLCNALEGSVNWIFKEFNNQRYETRLYFELIISHNDIKVKQINYNGKFGLFNNYKEVKYDTTE